VIDDRVVSIESGSFFAPKIVGILSHVYTTTASAHTQIACTVGGKNRQLLQVPANVIARHVVVQLALVI
jgi:hypothetical protein